jgi:hypothetical protein
MPLEDYDIGPMLAYRGRQGCRWMLCTTNPDPTADRCFGWHCATCHEPSSMQGHDCPVRAEQIAPAVTPPIGLSLGAFIERVVRHDRDA